MSLKKYFENVELSMLLMPVTLTMMLDYQGLEMSEYSKAKLAETGKELCEEREEALAVCTA
jgi:hypothetical protein